MKTIQELIDLGSGPTNYERGRLAERAEVAAWLKGWRGRIEDDAQDLGARIEEGEHLDDEAPRACRVCGCTDEDCSNCIERTGEACTWVSEELCSACVASPPEGLHPVERARTAAEERDLLHTNEDAALCDCRGSGCYCGTDGEWYDCPHHGPDRARAIDHYRSVITDLVDASPDDPEQAGRLAAAREHLDAVIDREVALFGWNVVAEEAAARAGRGSSGATRQALIDRWRADATARLETAENAGRIGEKSTALALRMEATALNRCAAELAGVTTPTAHPPAIRQLVREAETEAIAADRQVRQFNAEWPVGTPVKFWPGVREGEGRDSVTRSPAWLLGFEPVVSVTGYPGGISLVHVEPYVCQVCTHEPALCDAHRDLRRSVEADHAAQEQVDATLAGKARS